jgi:hypothetical protein
MGTAWIYAVAHIDGVCLCFSDFASVARVHKLPVPASARNTNLSVAGGPCVWLRIGIAPKSFRQISFPYFDYLAAASFFRLLSLKIV